MHPMIRDCTRSLHDKTSWLHIHVALVTPWSTVQRIDVINPGALAGRGGWRSGAAACDLHPHLASEQSRWWAMLRDVLSNETTAVDPIRPIVFGLGAECAPRSPVEHVLTEAAAASRSFRDTFAASPLAASGAGCRPLHACNRFAGPEAGCLRLVASVHFGRVGSRLPEQ